MATRKVSPSPFSAKVGVTHSDTSPQYPHFVTSVRQDRNRYAFVCESQPFHTLTSHGLPKRCPLCSQQNPIGTEIQAVETI
jgi:hypothetical protein